MDSDDDITLSRPLRAPPAISFSSSTGLGATAATNPSADGGAIQRSAAEYTQAVKASHDSASISSSSNSDSSSDSDASSPQTKAESKGNAFKTSTSARRSSASSTSASSASSSSSSGSDSSSDSDSTSSSSGSSSSSSSSGDRKAENDDDGFVRRKNRAGKPVRRGPKPRAAGVKGPGRGRGRTAGAGGGRPAKAASRSNSRSSSAMSTDSSASTGRKAGAGASGKKRTKKKVVGEEGKELGKRAAAAAAEEAQWGKTGLWTQQDEDRESKLEEVRRSFRTKLIEAMQEEEATKDVDLRDSAADAEMVLAGRAQWRDRERAKAERGRVEAAAAIALHASDAKTQETAPATAIPADTPVETVEGEATGEVAAVPKAEDAGVAAAAALPSTPSQPMEEDSAVETAAALSLAPPLSLLPPEGTASEGGSDGAMEARIALLPIVSSQGVRIEESLLEASMALSQGGVEIPSQAMAEDADAAVANQAQARPEVGAALALGSPASHRSKSSSRSSTSSSRSDSDSDSSSSSSTDSGSSRAKQADVASTQVAAAGLEAAGEVEMGPFTPVEGLTAAWRRARQTLVERLQARIQSIEQAVAYEEQARALERDKAIQAKAGSYIMSDLHSKVTAITANMMQKGKQLHVVEQMKSVVASKGMFGASTTSSAQLVSEVAQRKGLDLHAGGQGKAAGGSPVAQTHGSKSSFAALVHLQNPLEHLLHGPNSATPLPAAPVAAVTVARAEVVGNTKRQPLSTAKGRGAAAVVNLDSSDEEDDDAMEGLALTGMKGASNASAGSVVGASAPGSSPEGTAAHGQGKQVKGPDIAAILDAMATLKEEYDKRDDTLKEIARKGSEAARKRAVVLRARQKAAAQARRMAAKKGKLLKTGAMDDSGDDGEDSNGEGAQDDEYDGPVDEESTTALVADYLPPLLHDMFSLGEGLGTTSAGTAAGELLQAFATGRAVPGMTASTTATVLQRQTGRAAPPAPVAATSTATGPRIAAAAAGSSHSKGLQSTAAAVEAQAHPRFMTRQSSLGAIDMAELAADGPDASPAAVGAQAGGGTAAAPVTHSQHHVSGHAALAAFAGGQKGASAPVHALTKALSAGVGGISGGSRTHDPPSVSADKLRRNLRAMLQAASARQESQLEARKRGFKDQVALGLERARRTLREEYSRLSLQLEELLEAQGGQAAAEAYLLERAEKQAKAAVAARIAAQAAAPPAAPAAASLAASKPVVRTYGRSGAGASEPPATGQAVITQASKVLQFRVNDEGEGEYVEAAVESSSMPPSDAAVPLGPVLLPSSAPGKDMDDDDDFAAAEDDAAVAVTVARSSEDLHAEEEQAQMLRMAERAVAAAYAEDEMLVEQGQEETQAVAATAYGSTAGHGAGKSVTGAALASKGKLGAMFAKQASMPAHSAVSLPVAVGAGTAAGTDAAAAMQKERKERGLSDDEDALAEAIAAEEDENSEDEEEAEEQEMQPKFRRLKKGSGTGEEGGDADSVASSAVQENMDVDDDGEQADDEGATAAKPAARAILDEDDEEYEAARAAEEEAQARLSKPQTYADMIRAEAEAERRKKLGLDKGKRGKKYVDEQAELSDEEKVDGLGRFGAGKGQTLIGSDGKLVTRLVEEAEEARALGLGADVEAELAGAVVDDLSEDEAEGDHDRMYRDQEAQKEKEELRRLQKALATGSMGALRARARRGGEASATFARDAAQMDDMEQAEEQDELENDELALEERELERQRAAGPYAKEFIADEDEEEEEGGEAAEAARLAKELAARDAAALAEAESEDDDGDFDFETAMRKKAAAEARAERIRRERANAAKQAEQQEAAAVQRVQAGSDAGQAGVDPAEAEHLAHLQRLRSILKGDDSDSEEEGKTVGAVVGGRPMSMVAPLSSTGRTPSLSIQAPPLTSKTSTSSTPFGFGAAGSGSGPVATPALGLPSAANVLSKLMNKAKVAVAAVKEKAAAAAPAVAFPTSFGGAPAVTAPAVPALGGSRVPAGSIFAPTPVPVVMEPTGASRSALTSAFPPPGSTALGHPLLSVAAGVKGPVSFGAAPSAKDLTPSFSAAPTLLSTGAGPAARPLLMARQGSMTAAGPGVPAPAGPSAMYAGMMTEASMLGGAFSRMGSSLGVSALGMPVGPSFSSLGMPLGLGLGLGVGVSAAPSLGTSASAGGRLAVTAAGKKGLVLSKKDSNRQAAAQAKSGGSLNDGSSTGIGLHPQGGLSSTGQGLSMLGKRPAASGSLGGSLFQALEGGAASKRQRLITGSTIGK